MQTATRPQKIMLVITKSNWGGAQKYVYDIATSLNKDHGFEVTVLAGGNGEMVRRLKEKKVRVIEIPDLVRDVSITKDLKSLFWLFSTIRKEHPDVLHLNSSKAGSMGSFIGRLLGIKKIIFTSHGWAFNEERPSYQKYIIRMASMLIVLLSDKTICVSEKTKESLRAPLWLLRSCVVIHNGIPPIDFKESGAFFKDHNIVKKEKIAILSIGELHKSKGFDLALNYLAYLKHLSWEWHIVGEGEEREALTRKIALLELGERVFLHGHVVDASRYITSFDLFLLPSRTEALAYVAIEAIQTKLPIFASNAGGLPEVLGNDPGSMLINIRSNDTVHALQTLLLHLPVIQDAERAEIRNHFSLETMMEHLKKLYLL
jgi:glycosyltransferase involved in cell wall biosynthesis